MNNELRAAFSEAMDNLWEQLSEPQDTFNRRSCDEARAAVEALFADAVKDAERYRWLRDEQTTHLYVRLKEKMTTSGMSVCSGATLDHEVDKRIVVSPEVTK